MNCDNKNELILNLDKLHTTELGVVRMKRNLSLEERLIKGLPLNKEEYYLIKNKEQTYEKFI